nr:retrovirus-related Pol polyprotein from transposon TNT 1-94 [Tanacetum cinerariifolium]
MANTRGCYERRDGFSDEVQDLGVSRSFSWVKSVRHTSIPVILALTACKDYKLEQLDVKTVFLHGNLEEVIYMRQPSRYKQGYKVCLLKKSLYGLKQSPRQWYKRFDEYMLSNGFKRSSYDSCVYYRSYAQGEYIYLLLYVDDMLIACKSKKSVKMPLGGHFKLSLKDCLVRDCDVERMSKVPYANAVESLMYLMVCTRPDIAYAVSVVSRYLENPGLVYGTNHGNHVDITGFVDSDYVKNSDEGMSITGYALVVQGCFVSWKVLFPRVGSTTLDSKVIVTLNRFKETMRETLLKGLHKSANSSAVETQQLSSRNSFSLTVAKCTSSGIFIASSGIFIASSGNALEHFIPNNPPLNLMLHVQSSFQNQILI